MQAMWIGVVTLPSAPSMLSDLLVTAIEQQGTAVASQNGRTASVHVYQLEECHSTLELSEKMLGITYSICYTEKRSTTRLTVDARDAASAVNGIMGVRSQVDTRFTREYLGGPVPSVEGWGGATFTQGGAAPPSQGCSPNRIPYFWGGVTTGGAGSLLQSASLRWTCVIVLILFKVHQ